MPVLRTPKLAKAQSSANNRSNPKGTHASHSTNTPSHTITLWNIMEVRHGAQS